METIKTNESHSVTRMKKLINHNKIRYIRFFEMIQYTTLYSIFGFIIALLFEVTMPSYKPDQNIILMIVEIIIQLCMCTIGVFYIKKIVKVIPLLVKYPEKYRAYETNEYITGGIAITLMYLKLQPTLYKKLNRLTSWVGKVR